MADLPTSDASPCRELLLRDARHRLARLEIETHRLRAELARLEAQGEEEAAARLSDRLADEEGRLAQDRRLLEQGAPLPIFTGQAIGPPTHEIQQAFETPHNDIGASAVQPAPVVGFSTTHKPAELRAPADGRSGRPRRRDRRLRPAWTVSLAAHALLVLLLGGLSFALPLDQTRFLLANAADGADDFDDFVEVSLDAVETEEQPLELDLEPLASLPLDEPLLTAIDAPFADSAPDAAVIQAAAFEALPSDAVGLMMAETSGQAGGGASGAGGDPGGGSVQFFGARARGDRFVFVVDNSGSMTGGRMETTYFELLNSIGGMKPKQEFHVLFYSDQVYPMFFPESTDELIKATRPNKGLLEHWLRSVQMCKGDCLTDAMDKAAELNPHVVYLLTDGGYLFTGKGAERKKSRKLAYLTEETGHWPFTIHTLGMTVRNADAAEGLTLIARAHGGTFTPVGVLPAAAHLAKQKRILYNRTPGAVWGSEVR